MDTVYAALGRFDVRFRYLIVVAWLVITVVCVRTFPSLSSVTDNASQTISTFLPASAPSSQAANLAAPFQNTQYASATLVATRNSGPLTSDDQAAIDRLEQAVRAMPHVKTVRDLSTSPDGEARQAVIQADVPTSGTGTGATLVNSIRDTFGQVNAPAGLTFHLTGQLASNVDSQNATQNTRNALQVLSFLLIIVLLFVAFRSLLAPLITFLPAVLVLLLSSPAIAGAVNHLGLQPAAITQLILIVLVLGAGTDYGLFLTFRVREEMRRGLDPKEAVVRAVQTVGETITFSALTVIAALLTLVIAQFGIYRSLGPALAIGIALMLLAGLTLLPSLLAIFGRAVFWPTSTQKSENVAASLWGRMTGRLMQRPALTLGLGIVLFVGLALGQLGVGLGGFGGQSSGPAGADSTAGDTAIAAHYPNTNQNPAKILMQFSTSVWNHPDSLATAEQGLRQIPALQTILGPLDPNGVSLTAAQLAQLHSELGAPQALSAVPTAKSSVSPRMYNLYRATGQYISADGQTVQFIAILKDPSTSAAAINAIPGLRTSVAQVAQSAGAAQSGMVSSNAVAYDITQTSASDLSLVIPIVALLIAVLLGLVLRSVIAPLYLIVSVVLSFLAAWGLVALLFVHLGSSDGVQFILPFLLFVFLMALGSDYNILVMRRIREEAHKQPLRAAVREAISRTGGTVTAAGVILAGSFALLAFQGNTDQVRQVGFGVAAGILMDTFLIRTLLIPALVVLLGRWNWWPAPLFRRVEAEAGSAEQADSVVLVTVSKPGRESD
ncbi:MMPL family transporter [Ktedonobacter robiniae]|uniref:Membrane protein n=1 Tax=Ktedonobacter robiniae TaxID=2778365 RepID=A0ABQ3UP48_9CHLR|nr:MMPL family transporter [Ktedonobacter robiniae]GHO54453.1 membrane protein [Ktedonobacter robiniae]